MGGSEITAEAKAYDISSWLQGAVTDCANGDETEADRMYNDADSICDLIGDRIYDEARGEREMIVAIASQLREMGHYALEQACDQIIARHA